MPRTFAEILSESKSKELMLVNLFELNTAADIFKPSGMWQANFRHPKGWHDFGRGPTPEDALEDALSRAKGLQGPENRPIPRDAPLKEKEGVCMGEKIGLTVDLPGAKESAPMMQGLML